MHFPPDRPILNGFWYTIICHFLSENLNIDWDNHPIFSYNSIFFLDKQVNLPISKIFRILQ
jgi:hypothetical protein